jgi:hypothetical protein
MYGRHLRHTSTCIWISSVYTPNRKCENTKTIRERAQICTNSTIPVRRCSAVAKFADCKTCPCKSFMTLHVVCPGEMRGLSRMPDMGRSGSPVAPPSTVRLHQSHPTLEQAGKGQRLTRTDEFAFICEIVRETTWIERRMMRA